VVLVAQNEHETYSVVLIGRDGTEVLVVPDSGGFALPSVEIPRWQRAAENITGAVKAKWGEEVVCLFELNNLPGTRDSGIHYQVAEHWRTVGVPTIPTKWLPVAGLSKDSLIGADDNLAIQRSRAQCSEGGKTSPVGPFAALGWFKEVRTWVEEVVEPLGFHVNGNFRQLNASPTFSLIRFETDGPALWFKAVGEPNQREFPITCALSRLFPCYVPGVVATRPNWNGWLMREAVGPLLSDVQEVALWEKSAAALAQLQIDSIGHGSQILAAGARDVGVTVLSRIVEPFVETMTRLMQRQTKTPPERLDRAQLHVLGDRIQIALDALDTLGIPETLGHLDLNPGNIVVSPVRCVSLDWAEAYVGNPFLTFQYLLEHFRRTHRKDSSQESQIVESYAAPWRRILSHEAINACLAMAPLLAVFSYMCGTGMLSDGERLKQAEFVGYLRGLARRMDREARAWVDRSRKCTTQAVI